MRDKEGESKGFGFVCFKDPSSAEKATQHVLRPDNPSPSDPATDKPDKAFENLYVREAKKKD